MKKMTLTFALIAGLSAAAAAATYAPPASAQVYVTTRVGIAPPPVRYERRPPPRAGYVWAPGYWRWNGRGHVWAGGYWVRGRPGHVYRPAYWNHGRDGWRFRNGYWSR